MKGDMILVVDLGGYQARTIARMLRGESIYCEIARPRKALQQLESCRGIIIAGEGNGTFDLKLVDCGLPIMALGTSSRKLCEILGGQSLGSQLEDRTAIISFGQARLFDGIIESERYFDRVDMLELPEDCHPIAHIGGGLVPAFADDIRRLYGLQFYAETHDPDGMRILTNFALDICGCEAWWNLETFAQETIENLRSQIGDRTALITISGGVDSTVCAALMHKAIGDNLKCLYINNGLMRLGEPELVKRTFAEQLGLELITVDASEHFMEKLKGITSANEKRTVVREEMLNVISDEARRLSKIDFLVQATIYPDLLDKENADNSAANAPKTLLNHIEFEELVEPLRRLFKDEVRILGEVLGMSRDLIGRQPFPEAGLAVRCLGETTPEKLNILSRADAIFRTEIADAGLDKRIWQYFAILTGVETLGINNGRISRGYAVALRAVQSKDAISANYYRLPYDLLERVVERITREIPQINRVLYDITGKPPALIEWE